MQITVIKYNLKGHLRSLDVTVIFRDTIYIFFLNLISSKLFINHNTIKSQIFHRMKFDYKGNYYV